jgi:DNA-binding XRE family transcriptional regulator
MKSPIQEWREARGMSRAELAQACGLDEGVKVATEKGRECQLHGGRAICVHN